MMTNRNSPGPANDAVRLGATNGTPRLQLRIGHASAAVPGKQNEDFFGVVTPREAPEASAMGVGVALSDGVSGNGSGRAASETAVKAILHDYYGTPPHWNVPHALDKLLRATNEWLSAEGIRNPESGGMVCTFTMMLFRGNYYHMAHVGDARVYRRRGTVFKQLTLDHTWPRQDMRHVLKRAVGLDTHLVVDYTDGELVPGDTFLIVTDGVWEVLGEREMRGVLDAGPSVQAVAEQLVADSLRSQARYMGRNDATAILVAVEAA